MKELMEEATLMITTSRLLLAATVDGITIVTMRQSQCMCVHNIIYILYSRKYWRKLNLAVEPKIAIARILLADLNLAVHYGIAIRILVYASGKFWWILI